MQDFIDEIHGEIPKISKKKIFKIFMSIKYRYNNKKDLGLGKRDGKEYNISERQMTYFIDLLINTGHLIVKGSKIGNRGFPCRIFTLSKYILGEFSKLKDVVLTKIDNLSDRISNWEKNNKSIDYIKNIYGFYKEKSRKKWFKVNGIVYVIHTYGDYEDMIFDTSQDKPFTLFNFLKDISGLDTIKMALKLNIIG